VPFEQRLLASDAVSDQSIESASKALAVNAQSLLDEVKTLAPHEHHAHIKLKAPTVRPINPSSNLLAEGDDAMSYYDDASTTSPTYLTQAQNPPAIHAPAPDWIGNDKRLLDVFKSYLNVPGGLKGNASGYDYEPNGPLGIPALTLFFPVDFLRLQMDSGATYIAPQNMGLATTACLYLDVEQGRAGAWGPECKISRFITLPQGKLVPSDRINARPGTYSYTPRQEGPDKLRFILENGQGKQVDVTVKISVTRYSAADTESTFAAADMDDASAWLRSAELASE
jgi:hypothetical protein